MFACYEMLFRYYGLDASQVEALFNAGAGYSLGYDPVLEKMAEKPHRLILPSYKFYLHTSYEVSQGNKDDEFLCDLYGCDLDKTIIDSSKSSILKWIDYWELFKQNIASDMPVLCCIDPCSWPLYQELENLPASSFLARGAHMIVGVGYNIINRSICFHDPYAGYKNQEEKGKYLQSAKPLLILFHCLIKKM